MNNAAFSFEAALALATRGEFKPYQYSSKPTLHKTT
jgi:hypothetical protein